MPCVASSGYSRASSPSCLALSNAPNVELFQSNHKVQSNLLRPFTLPSPTRVSRNNGPSLRTLYPAKAAHPLPDHQAISRLRRLLIPTRPKSQPLIVAQHNIYQCLISLRPPLQLPPLAAATATLLHAMPAEDDRSIIDESSSDSATPTAVVPPHHTSPARTRPRTHSIIDSKAAATSQSLNPRLANLRSRHDWKQASRELPRPETSGEGASTSASAAAPVVPTTTATTTPPSDDDLRAMSPSPNGGLSRLGPLGSPGDASAPPDLPPPIPPHSYTFIPHLAGAPQVPGQAPPSNGPPTPSGPPSVAHPSIAPRQPPPPTLPESSGAAVAAASASTSPTRASFSASPLPRPHVCPLCTLAFARGHDLKRHTATHTGEKKFKCPNCGRAYGRKDALKRHACASGNSQAVFAVSANATAAAAAASSSPSVLQNGASGGDSSGSNSRAGAVIESRPHPGRSRGQLHAPPIVGAAAMMLGPRSQRPIKYKNSTPKDFLRPEEDPRGETDELEGDDPGGGGGAREDEEEQEKVAGKEASVDPMRPSRSPDVPMRQSEEDEEDEDEDADGD